MGKINVNIAGHNHILHCGDGEEERLRELLHYIEQKNQDLVQSLGQMGETRLLLMTAALITDELFDLREKYNDMCGQTMAPHSPEPLVEQDQVDSPQNCLSEDKDIHVADTRATDTHVAEKHAPNNADADDNTDAGIDATMLEDLALRVEAVLDVLDMKARTEK